MANAYILSPKWSDAGTLTGSATVGNGGVANLRNPKPRSQAVFTSGSCYVEGDFGVSRSINSLCMAYINSLSGSDTFRFRCKDSYPVTTDPLIDSTALPIWTAGSDLSAYAEIHKAYEFALTTARYWRVDFACSVAVRLSRLFPGKRVEPTNNVAGLSPKSIEPSAFTTDLGGESLLRIMGGPVRSKRVDWPTVTKLEGFGSMSEMLQERGAAKDFALVVDSSETSVPMAYIYVGRAPNGLEIVHNTFNHNISVGLEVVELAPIRMI